MKVAVHAVGPVRPVHVRNTSQTTAPRLAVLPHRPCASWRVWAPSGILQVSPAKACPPTLLFVLFATATVLQLFTAADELVEWWTVGELCQPMLCRVCECGTAVAQAAACSPGWSCARPTEECVCVSVYAL